MRLCIPMDVKPQGGVYTFLGNLLAWLDGQGVPHTRSLADDWDVLFVNSWVVPPATVRSARRRHPEARVVHRVDGAAQDYGSDPENDRLQARVNLLADLTIFQSEYSRHSTTEKFRVVGAGGPVIHNPVDVEQFAPGGPRLELPGDGPRVACAAWSVNRRKGTWMLDRLAAQHPDVQFVLCGRFDAVESRANVHRLGHLDRAGMARALRSSDVFLNLSENDPCPNVVLEALASALPVVYLPSGGVPELVGDCGAPLASPERFRDVLDGVLRDHAALAAAARDRAVSRFAPAVIFPRYMEAMAAARRRPDVSLAGTLGLAVRGYPVLPAASPFAAARKVAGRVVRAAAGPARDRGLRVGWVTYDSFPRRKRRFRQLDSFTRMRVGNVAARLHAEGPSRHELYHPERRYDVVVFQKVMSAAAQAEAEKIQAYGGKVVFDANVNYYEVWGDYFVPGTQPTDAQQRDARRMTTLADWVVADSTYLESVIRRLTPRVTWIPDNVDTGVYSGRRAHAAGGPVRLVWSGVGKKAEHLLLIRDVLAAQGGIELVLVVDETPACHAELAAAVPCSVVRFSDRAYARTLRTCDIIISPKRLVNAYEMGHTEYKITLGMAVGLPALASPQQSYREAIEARGGGIIADSPAEWRDALARLVANPALRQDLGERARQTVLDVYATPRVAARYLATLEGVAASFPAPARE